MWRSSSGLGGDARLAEPDGFHVFLKPAREMMLGAVFCRVNASAGAVYFRPSKSAQGGKMKQRIWFVFGVVALLAGCASSGPERDINDPSNSLVFGYVDMDDAPTSVSYASLVQVAPPTKSPYWGLAVHKGLFYSAYLPPGSYQLSKFGGSGFFAGQHEYSFPRQGNQTALRIVTPGIYYLGSFKYKTVSTGMFEQGKFSMEKVKKPSEAELLKRILAEGTDIPNSAWRDKIRARLAQLK
jgi:hypothetical protein